MPNKDELIMDMFMSLINNENIYMLTCMLEKDPEYFVDLLEEGEVEEDQYFSLGMIFYLLFESDDTRVSLKNSLLLVEQLMKIVEEYGSDDLIFKLAVDIYWQYDRKEENAKKKMRVITDPYILNNSNKMSLSLIKKYFKDKKIYTPIVDKFFDANLDIIKNDLRSLIVLYV